MCIFRVSGRLWWRGEGMRQWPGEQFHRYCLSTGLVETSAHFYSSHLRRLDEIVGGLDALIDRNADHKSVDDHFSRLPTSRFRSSRDRSNMLSVLRKYLDFKSLTNQKQHAITPPCADKQLTPHSLPNAAPLAPHILATHAAAELSEDIRSLAVRYRKATGKPLGVTGELAELAAMELLGVELADARTAGFDGWLQRGTERLRVQIKGRAVRWAARYVGRCPAIKCGDQFDIVLLVLIDQDTMRPGEIWEAKEADVINRLAAPGSKSRNERNSMGISQFKSIATLVWSAD